jgi:beta-barrel assembly-enhancing protease
MRRQARSALPSTLAVLVLGVLALPLSAQTKRIPSDTDLNAIGTRRIDRAPNLYSVDDELKMGEALSRQMQRASNLITDLAAVEYINRIAAEISNNSDTRFPAKVAIIDSDAINAITLPAGFLYVNTGLILQTQNEAEFAGVLAYGIAHTALRTNTNRVTKDELLDSATMTLLLLGPVGWAGPGIYKGLNIAIPLVYLKYRRDAELDADYFGLQYLCKAAYDPESYVEFIERVWPLTKDNVKAFSSFLPLPDRLQAMRKEISEILPQRSAAKISSGEFDNFKEHLQTLRLASVFKASGDPTKPTLRKK